MNPNPHQHQPVNGGVDGGVRVEDVTKNHSSKKKGVKRTLPLTFTNSEDADIYQVISRMEEIASVVRNERKHNHEKQRALWLKLEALKTREVELSTLLDDIDTVLQLGWVIK